MVLLPTPPGACPRASRRSPGDTRPLCGRRGSRNPGPVAVDVASGLPANRPRARRPPRPPMGYKSDPLGPTARSGRARPWRPGDVTVAHRADRHDPEAPLAVRSVSSAPTARVADRSDTLRGLGTCRREGPGAPLTLAPVRGRATPGRGARPLALLARAGLVAGAHDLVRARQDQERLLARERDRFPSATRGLRRGGAAALLDQGAPTPPSAERTPGARRADPLRGRTPVPAGATAERATGSPGRNRLAKVSASVSEGRATRSPDGSATCPRRAEPATPLAPAARARATAEPGLRGEAGARKRREARGSRRRPGRPGSPRAGR